MHILQILGCRTYFALRMLLVTTIALISACVAQNSFAQSVHISSLNIRISEILINHKVSLGLKKSIIVELPEYMQPSVYTTSGLNKLPILGKLFQGQDFIKSELGVRRHRYALSCEGGESKDMDKT